VNEIAGVLLVLFDTDAIQRALERTREARDSAQHAEQLNDSILNSMSANVAVLNAKGLIVKTNDAWNRFARENGGPPLTAIGPSANYLEICERAAKKDAEAQQALTGIRSVLNGHSESFHMEYPCHSANEQRWFVMNVAPLKGVRGGAVITHTNISDRKLAEVAAETNESMIRALLASAPQSVVAVGEDRKIVFVNGNVDKMFGYSQEDLFGQPLDLLIPEGARARHEEHHKLYFANMQTRPMGIGLELEARRKDGMRFPVEIGLGAIQTEAGKLAVAFVSDITERKRMEEAAQTHAREIHALAASLMTAQEEERRRVSRELHDQICQQLASLAIDMGSLAVDAPLPPDVQGRLKGLQSRIVKASEETRHIAYELHPSVLDDLGLVASLRDLSKEFSKLTGAPVKFTHDALPASIPREIASCLYRVAREALHNIAQHATPKHVSMKVALRKERILLTIADNGVGFDPQAVKSRGGLGLIGMEERARVVDGQLSIKTQPGHGTRIALEIPCSAV
jgi:PAS domain S-box-containing protein